jgi:hypothetical protein
MKQTAVEWLAETLRFANKELYAEMYEDIEQAKEMEKEQMVDFAFKYGDLTTREIADSFDKEYKTNEK